MEKNKQTQVSISIKDIKHNTDERTEIFLLTYLIIYFSSLDSYICDWEILRAKLNYKKIIVIFVIHSLFCCNYKIHI